MAKRHCVIHNEKELAGIRRAAQLAASVLDAIARAVRPGLSTLDLDQLGSRLIVAAGARSAFHNYRGFPGQICISVNDEVVHGIGRAERFLQYGDIVSLDVGIRVDGCIGDTARTVSLGPPVGGVARLLAVTQEGLRAGIAAAVGGNTVWDISTAVNRVARQAGFGVVEEFVGHGVGTQLHEPPEVPNYPRHESRDHRLRPGMVLAIEPMFNAGTHKIKVDSDHWTVRSADGSWSAHFEHMVLITEQQPEVLTWPPTASA